MREPVPHPAIFRVILIPLGLVQAMNGFWALLAPRSFYDDFPPGPGGWVSALPAYDEHLVRDVGGLFLGTAVILLAAAIWLERRLLLVALASWLAFAVPHAIWHLFNLGPYSTGDAIGNVVTLALTVLVPGALLVLMLRARPQVLPPGAPAGGDGTRIPVVDRTWNPFVRYAFRSSRKQAGSVVEPVRVHAHHPLLLAGFGGFELATMKATRVPYRLKALGEMKAAQLAGCEWCLDFGSALSRAHGITDDELRDILDYRASDRFSELEKLVLDYATGMSRTPVDVPDELFARLREHFDEAQLVELTSVIALENYRARFNWAFGIEGEGFSQGAYCVRPSVPAAPPAPASSA